MASNPYQRPQLKTLALRLHEPRRFIQVLSGPRQVGKTTLIAQLGESHPLAMHVANADQPGLVTEAWMREQWQAARQLAAQHGEAVLVLDEIQKLPGWSDWVKTLWDQDTRSKTSLKVVLLGSAPLLVAHGLSESLTGRFELIHMRPWSFDEMSAAFGVSLDQYIFFGGYPGSAALIDDEDRWRQYVLEALIEPTLSRDVLLLARVDKPALMRQLFGLGCQYSGKIVSLTKMLGALTDAGNTTTLSGYLHLLHQAGMLTGLQRYAGDVARRRASMPKFQVFNTALISAQAPVSFAEARANPAQWGQLVESAVGAHLLNASVTERFELAYWRDGNDEVDFVAHNRRSVVAFEVKTGSSGITHRGSAAFAMQHPKATVLRIGTDGMPLDQFLRMNPARLLQ